MAALRALRLAPHGLCCARPLVPLRPRHQACSRPSARPSDAAIVFKDPVYAPYIDQLCKFFFLSSAIHQTVFCLLSTLPFSGK